MSARQTLDGLLVAMASRGQRPRCGEYADRHLWVSDDRDDRRRAAELCAQCPLLQPCAEAAEEQGERWHVFGGKDRTRPPKKKMKKESKP